MAKSKEKKKKTPAEIINDIQESCKLLGWCIAMNESSQTVGGLIIGVQDFVVDTVDQVENKEEYSIYTCGEVAEIH